MVVRNAEAGAVALVVRVVRDDADDVGLELVAAPAPEQVEQAMVVARGKHRGALRLVRVGEPPAHSQRLGHLIGKRVLESGSPLLQAFQSELHPHEKGAALGVGRVLVGAEDVGVVLGEEARYRGHDPVPVGTRDEQPRRLLTLAHLYRR